MRLKMLTTRDSFPRNSFELDIFTGFYQMLYEIGNMYELIVFGENDTNYSFLEKINTSNANFKRVLSLINLCMFELMGK